MKTNDNNSIYLYLENGEMFKGISVGHESEKPVLAEIVFNTSMWGYQEVFTDPSYCDQAVVMTYPLQGNYGINYDDSEAINPHLKAVIMRECCDSPSNFRNKMSMTEYLKMKKIPGIAEVDTRELTKMIRTKGTMKCIISEDELSSEQVSFLLEENLPTNQIEKVSTKTISHFPKKGGKRIVLVDYGYKKSILESLLNRNCEVYVVPYDTSFEEIKNLHPHGILLSNGPGDPESIMNVIPTVKKLQDNYPMFCICMGHEIFALANGAKISKMKFGHRGGNHPVKDLSLDRVYITAQNHGYCVDTDSIEGTDLEITQINLNDQTIEGLKHNSKPAYSVQYHPEASPGPNDTKHLFDSFIDLILKENTHA